MKNNTYNTYTTLLLTALVATSLSCTTAQTKQAVTPALITWNDTRLQYMGRIGNEQKEAAVMYWPGSSVTMRFTGTAVKALIKDEKGNNYFNVIIDGTQITKFKPDANKQLYTLAEDLRPGRHTIQLFKLTESAQGKTWFYGFQPAAGDSVLPAAPLQKRKMEFFGASSMAGFSIEAVGPDSRQPDAENNYLSYAAVTARHYDAAYHCIAKTGIGFMVSWFPLIMPEMYDRLDPTDPNSKWDFSKYTPNVVVMWLGGNDAEILASPASDEFKARFRTAPREKEILAAYRQWVQLVRNKYPEATIICELENKADGIWPGYLQRAVAGMGDPKIFAHLLPLRNTPGHPRINDHKKMADSLIAFIDAHVKW